MLATAATAAAAPTPAATSFSDARRFASPLFPRFESGVPVLLYHRLARGSVGPEVFDAQMQRLHELGFEAITLDRYVRFVRGEHVALPERPILITFDDAFRSSWASADPVLARYGWSAVMYVPTGYVGLPGRLTWEELRQMQASGRWQMDEHAGDGHVLVTVDAAGRRRPFYANELWADGRKESFEDYKRRASGDIERGAAHLARNIPRWRSHGTFAVPFGKYGQNGSNDPRIGPWLSAWLTRQFSIVFVQRDDSFAQGIPGFANRITVAARWDADTLATHLLRGRELLQAASREP